MYIRRGEDAGKKDETMERNERNKKKNGEKSGKGDIQRNYFMSYLAMLFSFYMMFKAWN